VQVVSPELLLNVPTLHKLHAIAESAEYLPGAHVRHCAEPVADWNVPAAQFEHIALSTLE